MKKVGMQDVVENEEGEAENEDQTELRDLLPTRKRTTNTMRKQDPDLRPITGKWDKIDSQFLKTMLRVEIKPTRFADEFCLNSLHLLDDAAKVFEKIGFGRLFRLTDYTHPKLVREFIATCRLRYKDPSKKLASQGTLHFFLNRKPHTLSFNVICEIFGFKQGEDVSFPKFPNPSRFWNVIAAGDYTSRGAKQTMIRNPVLRVVVKLISTTLFFKAESGSVRNDELWMLYYGVKHLIPEYHDSPDISVNFGAMLAEMLVQIKKDAENGKQEIHVGTILTPIFVHCGINLDATKTDTEMSRVNTEYLEHCQVLKKMTTYKFLDREGRSLFCKLPNRNITSLTSFTNLVFLPGPEFLVPNPGESTRPPPRSAALQPPPQQMGDFEMPPEPQFQHHPPPPHHQHYPPQPYQLLPSDMSEFDLPLVPPPEAAVADRQQWIIDTVRTNHAMLCRMWEAMTKIRPCACLPRSSVQRDGDESQQERPADAADGIGFSEPYLPANSGESRQKKRMRQP